MRTMTTRMAGGIALATILVAACSSTAQLRRRARPRPLPRRRRQARRPRPPPARWPPRTPRPRPTWAASTPSARPARPRVRSTSSRRRTTGPTTARSWTDFTAKYGIKVQSDQPDADSQDEINAATQLAGTGRQPDIFDLGSVVAAKNTTMYAPYQLGDLGRHPGRQQGPDRPLDQQLHRLRVDRLRREARHDQQGRRPGRPQVPWQGRSQRRPAEGVRRVQRRGHGLSRQRRLGRRHRPRRHVLQVAGRQRQPDPGRPDRRHDRIRPDPDRHRLDVQPGRPDRQAQGPGHRLEDRDPVRRAARGLVLQQAINKDAPHPAAARCWVECPLRRRPEHVAEGLRAARSGSRRCRRPGPSIRPRPPPSTPRRRLQSS